MESPYNPVASQEHTPSQRIIWNPPPLVPGTRKEFSRLARIWTSMLHLVLLQLATTVIASVIAGLIGGMPALLSTLLGGLCCVVPNGLFALRLFANAKRAGGANPMSFFIGEFIKIALTVTLLGVVAWLYRDLNWLALIAGFIVALKSYIILLFRH
jgi:ATP synthase protein I